MTGRKTLTYILTQSRQTSLLLPQHRPVCLWLAMHVPSAQKCCLQHPAKPFEYTPTMNPPRTPPPIVYTQEQLLSVKPSPLEPRPHFSPASFADWFRPTPVPRPHRRKAKTQDRAMSTFSPVGSLSANGMKLCVCVCVCVCVCGRNELEVCTTLAYLRIGSFRTMPVLYTSTRTHASSNHLRTAN